MSRAVAFLQLTLLVCALVIVGMLPTNVPVVRAQTLDSADDSSISLDIEPANPAPYQTVTITPSSTVFDLTSSNLTVTVNGQSYYQGSGEPDVSIPLGGPGTATTIVFTATSGGQTYTQSVTLRPAEVAVVVEPVSSDHPFYEGGGLISSNGRVRLVAVPDLESSPGHPIDPTQLVYTWKLGDQILEGDSGVGKNVLDALAPERYQDTDVDLTVQSQDGSIIAETDTPISPVDPITRIYSDDPLLGPDFDVALSNSTTMSGDEQSYLGVGYYFASPPNIQWNMNGTPSGTDPDITVRSSGSGTGSADLDFSATSNDDSSETSDAAVTVNFGQNNSGGLFGL